VLEYNNFPKEQIHNQSNKELDYYKVIVFNFKLKLNKIFFNGMYKNKYGVEKCKCTKMLLKIWRLNCVNVDVDISKK
jgi:alpha-glucuronidase